MTSLMAADLADSIPSVSVNDAMMPLGAFANSRSRPAIAQAKNPVSESEYTLASDRSMLSSDVDHWIQGYASSDTENTGVQGRVSTVQRSTLVTSSSLEPSGLWYILALVLPLFSANNTWRWRCTPSTVLHSAELLLNQLARFCAHARIHIRRLAHDQITRELFATAMDIVLVVYALGFLVLSLYQATMIE